MAKFGLIQWFLPKAWMHGDFMHTWNSSLINIACEHFSYLPSSWSDESAQWEVEEPLSCKSQYCPWATVLHFWASVWQCIRTLKKILILQIWTEHNAMSDQINKSHRHENDLLMQIERVSNQMYYNGKGPVMSARGWDFNVIWRRAEQVRQIHTEVNFCSCIV